MELRVKVTRNNTSIGDTYTEEELAAYLKRYISCYGFHKAETERDFPEYSFSEIEFH